VTVIEKIKVARFFMDHSVYFVFHRNPLRGFRATWRSKIILSNYSGYWLL